MIFCIIFSRKDPLRYLYFLLFQNVLDILQNVFGENNLCVAMVHEDLGYASYVQEYSTGEFENARYEIVM
jgi:hypothetical protein